MAKHTGNSLGLRLCEILGIDSSQVRSLVVRCAAGELATVEVIRFVEDEVAGSIQTAFERYTVHPKEPEEPA